MEEELTFDQYQNRTMATAQYPRSSDKDSVSYCVIGLVGEAGEIANKYKKFLRGDYNDLPYRVIEEKKGEIAHEIGDTLWYLARLADELGYSLSALARENLDMLQRRKDAGTVKGSGDNR